jgi:LysM domain
MRSKEFITEKGPGGGAGSPGPGPGREMTDAQRAEQAYQGEKNVQRFKNWWNNAPQTGAASNMARDPAQLGGQGRPENSMDDSDDFYAKPFVSPVAAAPVADVPLPQNQRTLRDPNSLNQTAPVADVPLPQNQRTLRDPNSLNQTAPAAGAAHAGQGGSNYTTGVEQDRPHRPDAGADETTRNDYPYVDREGNRKKNDTVPVKPVQNPQPLPGPNVTTDPKHQSGGARRPWGTVKDKDGRQVYIDNDGGKWVWPSNSTAWQPANMVPGSDYIDKPLRTTTGYTPTVQGATPATTGGPPAGSGTIMPGVKDSKGRQVYKRPDSSVMAWDPTTQLFSFYDAPSVTRGSESGKDYVNPAQPRATQAATPAPAAAPAAASSVTVKSGDTLSKIAAANGTTVQAIMAANPSIRDANKIAAGQTVKLRESSDLARIRHLAGLTRN